ncbi:MAG: hypothetical protein ACK4WH_13200 [Phycisphaerales bacterium]
MNQVAWSLPADLRAKCRESVTEILHKPGLPDSLRVSAGLSLLRLIGNEVHPGKGELPNPWEHGETGSVWAAMHDPLQRLAALAESKSIDSTPLRSNFQARFYAELDQLDLVVNRLELVECGPHTGPLAARIASIRAMFYPQTIEPPTAPAPHDPLDRPQRAAAAKALPARTEVVLWEGAEHNERNVRLARTRSAYLEAHGDVRAAMRALEDSGNPVARSTFYNHLDALDVAIPRWRESVQLSNPTGNLDGMRNVGTRGKSRDKVR